MISYFYNIRLVEAYTDRELITRWKGGDEQAFELLYKKHAVQLLGIALNKSGDRESAKEFVQESFISLYQSRESIEESTSVSAYLYVILKHKLINFHRKGLLHRKYTDYVQSQTKSVPAFPHLQVETKELERRLLEEIDKLPPQCRAVFKLSREQYLSDKEIAAELKISVNTVEQHKRKALRMLRVSLGRGLGMTALLYLIQ